MDHTIVDMDTHIPANHATNKQIELKLMAGPRNQTEPAVGSSTRASELQNVR